MDKNINWKKLIDIAITNEASDIHLTGQQQPYMRCSGKLTSLAAEPLSLAILTEICAALMTAKQLTQLEQARELDFSWQFANRRFRVHAYYQQGQVALALRLLPSKIPTLASLGVPSAWQSMKSLTQGLILVTGRTGSGKSTTLAAFIEELIQNNAYHVVTLEDPIEYLYSTASGFISQRELGKDFFSFPQAIRASLREAPDVIFIGEIRDRETMAAALWAAFTGALVLGTIHADSIAKTFFRIESFFASNDQARLRYELADVLRAIFTQQLLPAANGARVCLTEVLINELTVSSIIKQGKYYQLPSIMLQKQSLGMQTREMALAKLYQSGKITKPIFQTWQTKLARGDF